MGYLLQLAKILVRVQIKKLRLVKEKNFLATPDGILTNFWRFWKLENFPSRICRIHSFQNKIIIVCFKTRDSVDKSQGPGELVSDKIEKVAGIVANNFCLLGNILKK